MHGSDAPVRFPAGLWRQCFKQDNPGGRIGNGNMIIAGKFPDVVTQRATHDQPHNHLDALRTDLVRQIIVGELQEPFRIVFQAAQEFHVKFSVDMPGSLPIQLMRQPAGAKDDYIQIFLITCNGATDRLSKTQAASCGGEGVLHHIDIRDIGTVKP